MEKKPIYTLQEIAKWIENDKVSLPTVQRGFVWKASQIENLWDSLLRGYPVGAFVLSPKKETEMFEMLDGQQRATAICLGFGKATFRDSQEKIRVFIDLEKPRGEDSRKFIFRVITHSHPWGYQKTDNTRTLTSENIRKAMNLYNVDDHLETPLINFFPFDAALPIPFNFLIESVLNNDTIERLMETIEAWPHWQNLLKNHLNKIKETQTGASNRKIEFQDLENFIKIKARLKEYFDLVKKMLDPETGQKIPALYLNFDQFRKDLVILPEFEKSEKKINDVNEKGGEEENDETVDEVENLFIRLNAGGTPLRGEELNYSILKANLSSITLQQNIEEGCKGFFKPARFISVAYRLYQHHSKNEQSDGLTMRIKPKQFQKTVSEINHRLGFEKFLIKILSDKTYSGKSLLVYARHLLDYDELNCSYGLPYLISKKIADEAPEVIFMFLFRILIKGDCFEFNTDLHRKMVGMISMFMWLGKGEKQRDHSKLLNNIWPCVNTLLQKSFWSSATVRRAQLNEILTPMPSFDKKYDQKSLIKIKNYTPQRNSDMFTIIERVLNHNLFAEKMFYNRDLVLYAQRKFLSKFFKNKQYDLDDTNMPFDWDHISPQKFILKKQGIPFILKQCYGTIGNFRAWPYSLNRIDQDTKPSLKLDPLNPNSHIDSVESLEINIEKWDDFIRKNINIIKDSTELSDKLLDWSYCSKNWIKNEADDIKKDWKVLYNLIIERNLELCKEWYKNLKIENLLAFNEVKPNIFLNNKKWKLLKKYPDKEIKDDLNIEDYDTWISTAIKIANDQLFLFCRFSKYEEDLLNENNTYFGVYQKGSFKNPNRIISKIKFNEANKYEYDSDIKNCITGYFTLISSEPESLINLINNFQEWLSNIPNRDMKKQLPEIFKNTLLQKYSSALK